MGEKYFLEFNNYQTSVFLYPDYKLLIITSNLTLKKVLKPYFYTNGSPYKGFLIKKDNSEELIDFICGTKWSSYLDKFMSQVVESLTNDKL